MATLTSLPREVLKWLLSLDLSYPVKNVKRDFANGFLFAEVLSRYYPSDIDMHSFENVTSTELKRANWMVLEKLFKRRSIPIDSKQVEAVMGADGNSASELLQLLYAFINSDAYTLSLTAGPPERPGAGAAAGGNPYAGYTAEEVAVVAWQQQMYFQQQVAAAEAMTPNSKKQHITAVAEQLQSSGVPDPVFAQQLGALIGGDPMAPGGFLGNAAGAGGGASVPDELAYSKKPRPVQYKPYGMRDYEERAYDVKRANGYWQLGRLGPENENVELLAKREKNERIKQLGRQINATNQERISLTSAGSSGRPLPRLGSVPTGGGGGGGPTGSAGSSAAGGGGGGGGAHMELSARERAVEYARSSVPRPEPARKRPQGSPSPGGAAGAAAAVSSLQASGPPGPGAERLERLQQQHEADSEAVEAIRRELERALSFKSNAGGLSRRARPAAAPAGLPKAPAAAPVRRTGSQRSRGSDSGVRQPASGGSSAGGSSRGGSAGRGVAVQQAEQWDEPGYAPPHGDEDGGLGYGTCQAEEDPLLDGFGGAGQLAASGGEYA